MCSDMWQIAWEASCILATPDGNMNFGTIQLLLNSVSYVYGVLSKRHIKAKVTDIFVLIDKALSLAAVCLEIWYVLFLHRFGSPENLVLSHVAEGDQLCCLQPMS